MICVLPTVFSTYVEMIPDADIKKLCDSSVLHVCGDDPQPPAATV